MEEEGTSETESRNTGVTSQTTSILISPLTLGIAAFK